jgi:hypothetical protein
MTTRSRLPAMPADADPAMTQFLDAIDRRQLTVSQLDDLDSAATLPEAVAKINQILAAHRTK